MTLVCRLFLLSALVSVEGVVLDDIVKATYSSFHKNFPHHHFMAFENDLKENLARYGEHDVSTAYNTINGQQYCKFEKASADTMMAAKQTGVAPFKNGTTVPLMGMSMVSKVQEQLEKATGPAAAMVPGVAMLAKAALMQVKGVLQTVAAVVATEVPPMIPPPAWNNMPFPCLPMVTGHNCAGAVLYPITIGDFIMADLSDSAISGVKSSFPSYYRSHVGVTDDATYQRCYSAYMSMQCANTFPVCTTVQASQAEIPGVGRGPMCFLHCIATLIACPGMWIDDLEDICTHVSAPPMCSFAVYARTAPQQLRSADEGGNVPRSCPGA